MNQNKYKPQLPEHDINTGQIYVEVPLQPTKKKQYGLDDFQILKLIGEGGFSNVYQVLKKDTSRIYAMKVLQKKFIVQEDQVAQTLRERNILAQTVDSPFIIRLKFSFKTPTNLYLVTDFMPRGDLFRYLRIKQRFDEP
jgi:serine/threonine protein kinase SCH9